MNIKSILKLIGVVITLIIIFASKNKRKRPNSKLTKEQIEYNKILDYITDLCINFDNNNRKKYTNEQLTVISIMEYYNELMNGGLCQFFTNSSRIFCLIVSVSLGQINAKKHQEHFEKFIKENKINVNKLEAFTSENVDKFLEKYDLYPFDEFDEKFYDIEETEKLCNLIVEYTKNNYNEIFRETK